MPRLTRPPCARHAPAHAADHTSCARAAIGGQGAPFPLAVTSTATGAPRHVATRGDAPAGADRAAGDIRDLARARVQNVVGELLAVSSIISSDYIEVYTNREVNTLGCALVREGQKVPPKMASPVRFSCRSWTCASDTSPRPTGDRGAANWFGACVATSRLSTPASWLVR